MNASTEARTKKEQLNEGLCLGSILKLLYLSGVPFISKRKIQNCTNLKAGRNLKDLILHFHFIGKLSLQKLI